MLRSAASNPAWNSCVVTSFIASKRDSLRRMALTLRKSQSRSNWKPAEAQRVSRFFISARAGGHSAHILAKARSPFESFVPPLFTRLKMSTTTSTVLSSPVTSSMWNSICLMLRSRLAD